MKSLNKVIVTALIAAFGLTGCYTQLEYSQRAKRITDDRPARGYAWGDREERGSDSIYIEETRDGKYYEDEAYYDDYAYGEDEGYIPVYYKDYNAESWWNSCNCNPYSGYAYGGYDYYDPWYSSYSYSYRLGHHFSPYYSRWKWRHFGFGFHHNNFSMSLFWGSPHYYSYWYDPFYGHGWNWYQPYNYWGGYYSSSYYWYKYGYYNGKYRGGRYYGDVGRSSRTYRPRSSGTNRVVESNRDNRRIRSVNSRGTQVRSRDTSTSRSEVRQSPTRVRSQARSRNINRMNIQKRSGKDTSQRSRGTTIQRRSSQSDNSSGVRQSRDSRNIKRDTPQRSSRVGVSRTTETRTRQASPVNRIERSSIESRVRQQRAVQPDRSDKERSSFFGRFKKMINSGDSNSRRPVRINRNNNSSSNNRSIFRSRSRSNNNSSINRSRSSSNRSTSVTRSRSSSSSKARSSRSRSSSSSSRSRGNN